MGALAEIVLRFLDLLEAEGRTLRRAVVKLGLALVLLAVTGVLAVAGLGLIVWSLYLYLRLGTNQPTAALFGGLITLILAGMVLWSAKGITR